ncbi:MAG: hypothetical protein KF901_19235 [Myxococcales bacterium]|nr:hypothetical protein [Myxococcales bacterium]
MQLYDDVRRGALDPGVQWLSEGQALGVGVPDEASAAALVAHLDLLLDPRDRPPRVGRGPLLGDALLRKIASGARVDGPPERLAVALVDATLLAALAGDAARLELLARGAGGPASAFVTAWRAWLHQEPHDPEPVVAAARALGLPGLLAHGEALAALLALDAGALEEARERARRASRIARSDGVLAYEYVANLALARVRRFEGRWYLAFRILDALARVAPAAWRGFVGWELTLVGARSRASELGRQAGRWAAATEALSSALGAAAVGDRSRWRDATAAAAPWPVLDAERRHVVALLDLEATASSTTLEAWLHGAQAPAPEGLSGLVGAASILGGADAGRERAGVVVCTRPGRRPRRVLVDGLALLGLPPPATYDLQHGRVLRGLVALALATDGRRTDVELFRDVYGFAFVPTKHAGVLRTLLYRMRQELEGRAEIGREDDELVLRTDAPLVIPDPTCTTDLREQILRLLADRGGRASARDVAETLGVPLRTVQEALGQLVGDESCRRERLGRAHEYALEDTTFFAPTITRLGAWRAR